ncbi:multicopper oxidase family protein [Tsukamurella sp. 1534]|uniref:multicopper oxidase family protein n=1 Tax=Tsukamurella sp. 1534 TaxID=1151061 RepID=UPI0006ACD85F|nr:multicopper oxidase domain-containing protein [Tsukamurella sp. 1534]
MPSRRTVLRSALAAFTATLCGAEARALPPVPAPPIPPIPVPVPDMRPVFPGGPPGFYHRSPVLRKFVDALAVPPVIAADGARLTARPVRHRYHRDLPATRLWGFHDGVLGPVLEARSGRVTDVTFVNALGVHPLATSVEVGIGGTTERDKVDPRFTVHLHGAETAPESDGHPMINWRNGGVQRNRYRIRHEAGTLWYHDHAMGITRLNVQAGLAGGYYVRDDLDTGRPGNPLGLPAGEYEIPLLIQDLMINPDGSPQPKMVTPFPPGYDQQGLMGDVAVVNGTAWPRLDVRRTVYRLRIVIAANTRTYRLGLDSPGHDLTVIGGDQGLLNEPVDADTVKLGPGERIDLLVDFRRYRVGDTVDLINTAENSVGNNILMTPDLREIIRFRVVGEATEPVPRVHPVLRDGARLPRIERPSRVRPDRTRTVTLTYEFDLPRIASLVPTMLTLNNLPFMSDDVDRARAGTVERWDIANVTDFEHPVHVHLARFLVIGRGRLRAAQYMLVHPVPPFGTRWAPPVEGFADELEPAPAWEAGWKDTVTCPAQSVTSILVFWPSADDLGFDPDAPIPVPGDAEVVRMSGHGAGNGTGAGPHGGGHGGGHDTDGTPHEAVRGYVWHCHNLEHEDHDMMQRIRVLP